MCFAGIVPFNFPGNDSYGVDDSHLWLPVEIPLLLKLRLLHLRPVWRIADIYKEAGLPTV